ncbi:saccharopine dehydrogenase NADP-binding domain-containing protein [Ignatzschineria rhizosphaerae]|uniref:Saccharopine dehydrogenase NADP-binding domain-containing protein n=2 Tax=Ignatzschineria rhizosphaerae TaxID=2923279 RepID=A0ABY3WWE0_9GAMM|nr:saccharopine dehydrogenase NADP-binding domain-containing protein [Ignatzschineria rhizosphaerae]UNM94932.1 saccharopine dehydrogenase NADP-binding domain-containing protein [Ignatzschineria rhizosphaerae]
MKLVILGAGNIATETAQLVRAKFADIKIVIADINLERAKIVADALKGSAIAFDASDKESIKTAIKGADLVFNAVGPFYRYGLRIIKTVIECGINYIDVCDEYDVTVSLAQDMALNQAAKDAEVFALFGMGFSPGISNLVAKWAYDLLDTTYDIEIASVIAYVPTMGMTVNDHMLHSMSGDVPQYVGGKVQYFPAWSGQKEFTFKEENGRYQIGYMGHPEGVTLGIFLEDVKNASIRFRWRQDEGNEIWQSFNRLGLSAFEVSESLPLAPRQYLARFMGSNIGIASLSLQDEAMSNKTMFQVIAKGEKLGQSCTVIIEYHGTNDAGDPTPYAAAAAISEALNGKITAKGLIPPEIAINQAERVAREVLSAVGNRVYFTEKIEAQII